MRRLIKTFPGLPTGAGIYELDDGTTKFFNCAPNGPLPYSEDLVDFDYPYTVEPTTGRLIFNKEDPYYHRLKSDLLSAGCDIDTLTTEEIFLETLSIRKLGRHMQMLTQVRWRNRKPKTLEQALCKALITHDIELFDELMEKIKQRETIGLSLAKKPQA